MSPNHIGRGAAVMLAAFLAVSFLYLMNERARLVSWDEFSYWGTVIRAVSEANTFHFHPNPLYFQGYPPGVSLFAYHVLVLAGYSKGLAFFAYAVLLLSFVVRCSGRRDSVGNHSFPGRLLFAALHGRQVQCGMVERTHRSVARCRVCRSDSDLLHRARSIEGRLFAVPADAST